MGFRFAVYRDLDDYRGLTSCIVQHSTLAFKLEHILRKALLYRRLRFFGKAFKHFFLTETCEKEKVGGKRYEARSRGRSFPDTLAF